jgi:hypothetical protein
VLVLVLLLEGVCWCCQKELVLLKEGASFMPTNRAGKQVSNLALFSLSRFHFLF